MIPTITPIDAKVLMLLGEVRREGRGLCAEFCHWFVTFSCMPPYLHFFSI